MKSVIAEQDRLVYTLDLKVSIAMRNADGHMQIIENLYKRYCEQNETYGMVCFGKFVSLKIFK